MPAPSAVKVCKRKREEAAKGRCVLRSLWGALGDGIERRMQEPDTEVMSDMLEALEEIIEMLEPALLPMEKLAAICEKLQGILADSAKRRAERLKRLEGEDFDEDEALAIEVRAHSSSSPWHLADDLQP